MNRPEEIELLETGSAVELKIIEKAVSACTDGEEAHTIVKLIMLDDDEVDGYQSVEWGSFGFIYSLAFLSFDGAKPRDLSEIDYNKDDYFTLGDMISNLSFSNSKLSFYCDYLRGRLVKTKISIESNGLVELQTTFRGGSLITWLDKLQGKKTLGVVA